MSLALIDAALSAVVLGADVVVIDDMIDTAGTLCAAAAHIKQAGNFLEMSMCTLAVSLTLLLNRCEYIFGISLCCELSASAQ